jgi:NAD(P)-dependent dehydrogenase (short-subunit alcohol dehydrogenase family)
MQNPRSRVCPQYGQYIYSALGPRRVESLICDVTDAAAHPPLARQGTPDDVAGVVTFLLSDAAADITGGQVLFDGEVVTTLRRALATGDEPPLTS